MYQIYNLECSEDSFEIGGYVFSRVMDYENRLQRMHKPAVEYVDTGNGNVLGGSAEESGKHENTYTAVWSGASEPPSLFFQGATMLRDVLLLWTLWGNRNVLTGTRVQFEQHHYYNDRYFMHDSFLIEAINVALGHLLNNAVSLRDSRLSPVLLLMKEAGLTPVWQSKMLYISPAVDVVSGSYNLNKSDLYSEEEIDQLNKLERDLKTVLDGTSATPNVQKRVIQPYKNRLSALRQPTATDKLYEWAKYTIQPGDSLESAALYSQCIAFNQFRNSVVHFAGTPSRDVKVQFADGRQCVVSRGDHTALLQAGMYYYYAFKEILWIWAAKEMGVVAARGNCFGTAEVKGFLQSGYWMGEDPF